MQAHQGRLGMCRRAYQKILHSFTLRSKTTELSHNLTLWRLRKHIYLYKNIGKIPQKAQICQLLHPGSQIYCKTNFLSNGISKIDLSLRKTWKICPKSGFGSANLQLYLLRGQLRKNFKITSGASRKVRNVS